MGIDGLDKLKPDAEWEGGENMGRKVGKVGEVLEQEVDKAKTQQEIERVVLEAEEDLVQIAAANNVTLRGRKVG